MLQARETSSYLALYPYKESPPINPPYDINTGCSAAAGITSRPSEMLTSSPVTRNPKTLPLPPFKLAF